MAAAAQLERSTLTNHPLSGMVADTEGEINTLSAVYTGAGRVATCKSTETKQTTHVCNETPEPG
jgi:hypothetical protein